MNSRILNVVRLQFVNKQTFLWVPLIILAGTVLLNVMIVALVPGTARRTAGAHRRRCGTSSTSGSRR